MRIGQFITDLFLCVIFYFFCLFFCLLHLKKLHNFEILGIDFEVGVCYTLLVKKQYELEGVISMELYGKIKKDINELDMEIASHESNINGAFESYLSERYAKMETLRKNLQHIATILRI